MNHTETIAELKMQRGGLMHHNAVFTLTDEYLHHTWDTWRDRGDRSFALSELSCRLGKREAASRTALANSRQGIFLVIVSGLLIASPLRGDLLPLISFIGLIGIVSCAQGLPRFWTHSRWTVIQKKDGSPAIHIPHYSCSQSEREHFEKAFRLTMQDG